MKNRIIMFVCMTVMSFTVFTGTARAEDIIPDAGREHRVYDMAGLFTLKQLQTLEGTIAEYRDAMKLDLVVVTTEDAGGRTAGEYADDFYVRGGFGYSKRKNGVLFLIDMDNRELYISTAGDTIRLLTDSRIEAILDDVYVGAERGDYADSAECFLRDVQSYYKEGIESGQYNYDTETGEISVHRSIRWYEILLGLLVSGVTAGSTCLGVTKQYDMKKEQKQAANYLMAYRADCKFVFDNQEEKSGDKHVTSSIIPRGGGNPGGGGMPGGGGGISPGRSSTHTSSQGTTHGGGGRKF